ncbi:hypothetical protein AOQ84DRAFT_358179 [Glonium stellatum]|uniref:Uncharacterized protein n=1 Tax=Glonium stellatum TaxID=574774 RepID=A0A8E2K006_9PEZI|nr:hypothetical protein AOQ84DRAFT_358179 [Glonium stellatum]
MRSFLLLGALAVVGRALPQEIQWEAVDEAPAAPSASVPIGAAAQTVAYDPDLAASSAAAEIVAAPLPQVTQPAKRGMERRAACAAQPTGAGPIPSPDTAANFLSFPDFAAAASAAPTPSGYSNTFTNLQASNNAYGYLGFTTLSSYDSLACAAKCNSITGCSAFNLYFERDPTLEPATGCTNPPSTTVIKCVFWGGPVSADNAKNKGQWRNQFQVVIAGSNGYVSNSIAPQDGYTGPTYLGTAAINAPLDCAGGDTFMGSKVFTSGPFDAGLCSAACTAQSQYNLRHPPATGNPSTCQFYNTYILLKNGVSVGQYCAMYTQAWNSTWATNTGQYRGTDKYTIAYSYSFVNSTDPGRPAIPCPVASATSVIKAQTLQPYCSSLLGYTTPLTTVVSTESTAVPSTTIVDTSIPLTTTTVTTTSLIAVTQIRKRDLPKPTGTCTDDHTFKPTVVRRDELAPLETDESGKYIDVIAWNNQTTPAAVRRDAIPAGLSGFPASVISSACSLQATPVTTVSSIYTTTTATYTSGEVYTTTVLATSTVTETSTVLSTTTILVASSAPTGAIGYMTFNPEINTGANYCLSDDATHMTDNWFQKAKRETFIVTADGYLYSVTNDSYYYIITTSQSTLLYWTRNKATAMQIFSVGPADANGRTLLKMKDVSTGNFYKFCLSTSASGNGNAGAGMHFFAYKQTGTFATYCKAVDMYVQAV